MILIVDILFIVSIVVKQFVEYSEAMDIYGGLLVIVPPGHDAATRATDPRLKRMAEALKHVIDNHYIDDDGYQSVDVDFSIL